MKRSGNYLENQQESNTFSGNGIERDAQDTTIYYMYKKEGYWDIAHESVQSFSST